MLHTGDLIDFTSDGNDRVLRHNVVGLDFHYAIGNHEYQDRGSEHYTDDQPGVRKRLRQYLPNDLTVASRVLGGANFVSFDNAFHNLREETIAGVKKEFEKTEYAARLKATGVILSCICPLMYMNNPLCKSMPVITSSNKLRTYTTARYYTDDEILAQITKGGK